MFLVDSSRVSAQETQTLEAVRQILDRGKAEVVYLKKWDDRKLAYEIQGHKRGAYLLCYFLSDGKTNADIERDCLLSDLVLRVLILRADHMTVEDARQLAQPEQKAAPKAGAEPEPGRKPEPRGQSRPEPAKKPEPRSETKPAPGRKPEPAAKPAEARAAEAPGPEPAAAPAAEAKDAADAEPPAAEPAKAVDPAAPAAESDAPKPSEG
jgi:small subunit ribosomal protein S6